MYQPPSLQTEDPTLIAVVGESQDETEAQVQRIFAELEQLSPDTQLAVYTRLLMGLSQKLTAGVAGKAISAARVEVKGAAPRSVSTKKQSATRKTASEDVPRADSLLRELNDPTDPVEAWQRFGGSAAQLFEVLRQEPAGVLEAMLVHQRMPTGPKPRSKNREKLAEAIAVRMEQVYRGS